MSLWKVCAYYKNRGGFSVIAIDFKDGFRVSTSVPITEYVIIFYNWEKSNQKTNSVKVEFSIKLETGSYKNQIGDQTDETYGRTVYLIVFT